MGILKNGVEVDYNILTEKWPVPEIYGDETVKRPGYCIFKNIIPAIKLLNRHVSNDSNMILHTDVDVDGIGTTYIFTKALNSLGAFRHKATINRDKVHGIQQKHVTFFKTYPVDLFIITDSSCNELELIKSFNCDVLCIDHHELLGTNLCGMCNDGVHQYVIVNSTIDNDDYAQDAITLNKEYGIDTSTNEFEPFKGTQSMSCGLAVYELLRVYFKIFNNEQALENLMLYQWAGITLFTDVIDTLNKRNQWYIDRTVFNLDTEASLKLMMKQINSFKFSLDKSYIQYSFAPIINKAIRAGNSKGILEDILNNPENIMSNNDIYSKMQADAIEKATVVEVDDGTGEKIKAPIQFNGKYILLDISRHNIHTNYTGVIASRLQGDNNKNTAVCTVLPDGRLKGSFRGKYKGVDYRKYFENYSSDIYAQGHPEAFGFELRREQAEDIMKNLDSIEPTSETKAWLTAGNMSKDEQGIYHISDMNEFKRMGYIWKIATGNAKVISGDEIKIRVKASDVRLKETKGKLYIYDALGLDCKAFKPLQGVYFDVYPEYTNEICFYIKN